MEDINKIKIADKEYNLKFSLRGFILFEKISDKPFEIKNVTDTIVAAYSFLVSSNKDLELSFDDFLDLADKNPDLISKILTAFTYHEKYEAGLQHKEKKVNKKATVTVNKKD